nr:hypothetical protein BaRGS_024877 [Batillaria attramentaria]
MATDAAATDMITKRPRTPNDQYTCLSKVQMENIKKKSDSSPHFFLQIPHYVKPGTHRFMDRYATNTSQNTPYLLLRCYYHQLYPVNLTNLNILRTIILSV